MVHSETMTLPHNLGDGLFLRQATWEDVEALAAFNIEIHSDDPQDPERWLGEWTRDLLRGDHPTTGPQDVTVVVDQTADARIVSSAVLISQTWRYEEILFAVGRPELIGTLGAYRRRGLVRRQMELIHDWSAARGQLVQAITGIPYYYRRFGYEMALDLGSPRLFPHERLRKLKLTDERGLTVRQATMDDLAILQQLYERYCQASMVSRVRNEEEWQYEIYDAHPSSVYRRHFFLVETSDGAPFGYFEFGRWPGTMAIREIAAAPGCSLRDVALHAACYIVREEFAAGGKWDDADETPTLLFAAGVDHPVYQALAHEVVHFRDPYAWYMRVPDLPAFLRLVAPVLERRLAGSVVAGYTGTKRLNCTVANVQLNWKDGTLDSIELFEPQTLDEGDAFFPGLTFLQLLFGFRTLSQLHEAHPDCYYGDEETYVLLSALFPHQSSNPIGLG